MNYVTYSKENFGSLFVGLVDSDGCLSWTWNKQDRAFVPSVSITLKVNPELLIIIKSYMGGYVTMSNGNWQHKTIRSVQEICLPVLFDSTNSSSCKLVSSKRYDALFLFYVMKQVVSVKNHRKPEGKAILVDARNYLHFGKSRSGAKSSPELEAMLRLTPGSSTDVAKTLAENFEKEYEAQVQDLKLKVSSNCYLNAWQVVGFFLGDGGVHVVWGTQILTTTIHFTGDSRSAIALEIYTASLIQDNVYRKAWKSSKSDSSRLIIHGVNLFSSTIEPFFQRYTLPDCKKKEIFNKVAVSANCLTKLKEKQIKAQVWTQADWKKLARLIQTTWTLNPSGKSRKFNSPEEYLAHLKLMYRKNKLKIR